MSNKSPIGTYVKDDVRRHTDESAEFREEYERLETFSKVAHGVILRRAELGLTQKELADRIGTKHSAISRIESGRHATSVSTLQKLAIALDLDLVIDFRERKSAKKDRGSLAA